MPEVRRIDVSQGSFFNMARSVIDTFPNEGLGYIYGFPENGRAIITNVIPLISAQKRTPSEFNQGSSSENKRIGIERAIRTNGSLKSSIMGSYHSHNVVGPYENQDEFIDYSRLSKTDLECELNDMNEWNLKHWIEIVTKVKKIKYSRSHPIGQSLVIHPKKLELILRTSRTHKNKRADIGYHVTYVGYLLSRLGDSEGLKVKELPVRERKTNVSNGRITNR